MDGCRLGLIDDCFFPGRRMPSGVSLFVFRCFVSFIERKTFFFFCFAVTATTKTSTIILLTFFTNEKTTPGCTAASV